MRKKCEIQPSTGFLYLELIHVNGQFTIPLNSSDKNYLWQNRKINNAQFDNLFNNTVKVRSNYLQYNTV